MDRCLLSGVDGSGRDQEDAIRIMMGQAFGKRARLGCEAVELVAQGTAQ